MDYLSTFSSLTDILHAFAQALLVPDILLLLLFAGYAIFSIGSILAEFFTERRNFKVAMPEFLAALMSADEAGIPEVIRSSKLLNRQKSALLTVYDYRTLPGDALLALIRRLVNTEETRYDRITGRNNTAAKISPMLGLMGTLIPLGPGVAALGQNDVSVLSTSLLIAFDTTVAGLVVAAICLAIGKIRGNWYNDYLSALDSSMATMLQKIEDMRKDGTITAEKPSNYAFLFEQGLKEVPQDNTANKVEEKLEDKAEDAAQSAGAVTGTATNTAAAPTAGTISSATTPASTMGSTTANPVVNPAVTPASTPSAQPIPNASPATRPSAIPSTPTAPAARPASSPVVSPTPRVSSASDARITPETTPTQGQAPTSTPPAGQEQ